MAGKQSEHAIITHIISNLQASGKGHVKCAGCGLDGFWIKFGGKWKIYEASGKIHSCEKLDGCAFCKSKNFKLTEIDEGYCKRFYVSCRDCFAGGPIKDTEEEALKAWKR